MKILLSLLLSICVASGAITELYVKDAASGTGLGTSEADAMSYVNFHDYMVTGGTFTAVAGNRFNVKVGSYADRTTTTDTWANGGTATSPVVVRGYNSTIGDGYLGHTNDNGVLITTNMPLFTYTTGKINITGAYVTIESVNVSITSASASSFSLTGLSCQAIRCKVSSAATGAGAAAVVLASRQLLHDNDLFMTGATGSTYGVYCSSAFGFVDSNRISVVSDSCVGIGIISDVTVFGNVIFGNGGIGIGIASVSSDVFIRNNTIYGCVGDGIDIITGITAPPYLIGNIIVDGSAYGLDAVIVTNPVFTAYNRYRDNASGNVGNGGDWITATSYGSVTTDTGGAETDFVNAAGGNFNLVSSSPAKGIVPFKPMSAGATQMVNLVGTQTSSGSVK